MSSKRKNKPNKPKNIGTKKWREFEQLVARIEACFGPQGVKVTSPDHVADVVTGAKREVDASLRYQMGSSQGLITVECRDRKGVEDVQWIEQLVTKKLDINANKCIAVSSTGFSSAAVKKANHHGIDIRLVRDISEEDILAWFNNLYVDVEYHTFSLHGVDFALQTGGGRTGIQLADDLASAFASDSWNAPIVFDPDANKWVSVRFFLEDWIRRGNQNQLYDLALPLEEQYQRIIYVRSAPGAQPSYTRSNEGTFNLEFVGIVLDITRNTRHIQLSDHLEYSDESKPLAYAAQGKLIIDGRNYYTFLVQRSADDPSLPRIDVQGHGPELTGNYIVLPASATP